MGQQFQRASLAPDGFAVDGVTMEAPASRSGCGPFGRLVIVQIAVEEAAGFRAGICAAPPTFPLAAAKTDRYCAPVLV